jgi:putative ABC transport system ATP-binding protein
MSLIELTAVSRSVLLPDGETLHILRGVDLSVDAGEHIAVIGRSGSGKSTLLNIIGMLDTPSTGEYRFDGVLADDLSPRRRARARGADFGFIFQQFNLLPGRQAWENVAAPLMYGTAREFWHRRRLACEMLERVGLGDRADTVPEKLSGGEQQRVAIARSLVRSPRVVLSDEPTGALDIDTGAEVMSLIDEITRATGATVITITHDLAVAARAQRHYRLDAGVLSPIQLETRPTSLEVAS